MKSLWTTKRKVWYQKNDDARLASHHWSGWTEEDTEKESKKQADEDYFERRGAFK